MYSRSSALLLSKAANSFSAAIIFSLICLWSFTATLFFHLLSLIYFQIFIEYKFNKQKNNYWIKDIKTKKNHWQYVKFDIFFIHESKWQTLDMDARWNHDTPFFWKCQDWSWIFVTATPKKDALIAASIKTDAVHWNKLSWIKNKWWKPHMENHIQNLCWCNSGSWSFWEKNKQNTEINYRHLQTKNQALQCRCQRR